MADFLFLQDVITILAVILGVWVVLYLAYFYRNYPGNSDRPPYYIAVTLIFFIGVAVLLATMDALQLAGNSAFVFAQVVKTFSIVLFFGLLTIAIELARRWWRRFRGMRNRDNPA